MKGRIHLSNTKKLFDKPDHFNDAIDTVRREEARKYKGTNQEALLTNSRWPLLKNKPTALYHTLGKLPVPEMTHRFC